MNLRRIGVLFGKEVWQGPRGFIFIWAIVMPVILSMVLSLVFGTLFSQKPKLGVFDPDDSRLVTMIEEHGSVDYREYDSPSRLRQAVNGGAADVGIVIPDGFDSAVRQGEAAEITAYVWGESLAKNRTILLVTIADLIRGMTGQEAPVDIETVTLGDGEVIPWNVRLLPLIMLFAVFLGGVFLPATSLINEKEKKTLNALAVTPASIMDIFMAKGLLGLILSLFVGVVVLLINQALGLQPLLLVLVLALGAIMAVEIGLICGAVFKDVTTLFAVWKSAGILLFGPAIIYMFPQIPEWVGRIFPTYYMLEPIMAISQRGSGWSDIANNVFILTGLDIIIFGLVMLTLKKTRQLAA